MLFVAMQIISGICEMTYISAGSIGRLQALMQPDVPAFSNPIGAVVAYVTVAWDYIQNLWGIFWFDYPFFTGSWAILRYALFIPISVGVIVSVVLAAIRGVGSS